MKTRVIVSAIIEKDGKVFLQTRKKEGDGAFYSGLLEIPAGGVEEFEDVFEALAREVKEETGLSVSNVGENQGGRVYKNSKDELSLVFNPLFGQQMLKTKHGLHWIGFVFSCNVKGKVKLNIEEASDYQWVTKEELGKMLTFTPEKFFPLQYGVLLEYVNL